MPSCDRDSADVALTDNMLTVTADQLRRAAPTGDPNIIAAIAATSEAVFAKYALTSRNRALGFLSDRARCGTSAAVLASTTAIM